MSGNGESLSLESLFAFVDGEHSRGEEDLAKVPESTHEEVESAESGKRDLGECSNPVEPTESHVAAREEPHAGLTLPPALPSMATALPCVDVDTSQQSPVTVSLDVPPAPVPTRPPRGKHATRREGIPRALRGKHVADEDILPVIAIKSPEVTPVPRELANQELHEPRPSAELGQVSVASLLSVSTASSRDISVRGESVAEVEKLSESRPIDGRDLANEMRASIEERLAKMILQQPETDTAKPGSEPDVSKPVDKVDVVKAVPTVKPQDAPKGEVDLASTAAAEGGATPKDSSLFDEPPVSIAESMREANVWHRRSFVLKVGGAVAALALCAAVVGFLVATMPESDALQDSGQLQQEVSDSAQDASFAPVDDVKVDEKKNDEKKNEGKAQEERDLSGSVVYQYVATNPDGETRSVTETVQFTKDGLCDTSDMEVEFSDEDQAQEFLSQLKRDYGAALKEGSSEGSLVSVTIDVQTNKLDREGYEDGLRASVDELVIVKKS